MSIQSSAVALSSIPILLIGLLLEEKLQGVVEPPFVPLSERRQRKLENQDKAHRAWEQRTGVVTCSNPLRSEV